MSRSREGPRQFLKLFQGLLQTDRYSAYDGLGRARVVHAACWAHLRRKLVESVRLNPQDQAAVRLLELVNELFAVDAKAREENMGIAARTEEVDTEINAREGLILGKRRRMGYPHGSVGEIS